MKKNGFTLIELLGVFTILAIISAIIFPAVGHILSYSRERIYLKQINTLLQATYEWSLKNTKKLPSEGQTKYIMLSELKNMGYIENQFIDPNTEDDFPNDLVISVKNIKGSSYSVDDYSKRSGNFLYKVEIDKHGENKPDLQLELPSTPTGRSEYQYFRTINVGDPVNQTLSNELIDRVVQNIVYDNKLVSSIDTSKIGKYYIIYTIVDNNGYSNMIKELVTVSDTEAPEIHLTQNDITISQAEASTYDIEGNAFCTDNSGTCEISYSIDDEENYLLGIPNIYVVTYSASDPSGNTSPTTQASITIE